MDVYQNIITEDYKVAYDATYRGMDEYEVINEETKMFYFDLSVKLVDTLAMMKRLGHVTWKGHSHYRDKSDFFVMLMDAFCGDGARSIMRLREQLGDGFFCDLIGAGEGRAARRLKQSCPSIFSTECEEEESA